MTYFPMGDDAVPSFNTTKYPGVCKPSNQATLDLVYSLQNQLNRVAHAKKLTKIAVDGDLGPATVKLLNSALGTSVASCSAITGQIAIMAANARMIADSLGVPASVSGPKPSSPPVLVLPTGEELAAKPRSESAGFSLDALTNMSTPMMIGLAALTVGIGYYLLKSSKKKGHMAGPGASMSVRR